MATIKNYRLESENWYYVQIWLENPASIYSDNMRIIVFAATPKEATEKATKYVAEKGRVLSTDVFKEGMALYHKNYVRDARKMMSAGLFV